MTQVNPFLLLQDVHPEELILLKQLTADFNEIQLQNFIQIYAVKRKKPQETLLLCLLGFIGFAGIHRFILGQIAMGVIYFLTAGFCFIGTIIDLINYQSLTLEYNKKAATETRNLLNIQF